jgi:hypothetical protein
MVFGNRSNLFNYYGKAKRLERGVSCNHPLVYHSLDVAAVGFQFVKTDLCFKKKQPLNGWFREAF